MTKVYNTKINSAKYPCSIPEYLNEQLEGVSQESDYGSDQVRLNQGNFIPLLKLITEKLHAAKMISDQELLEALGGGCKRCSSYLEADK